MNKKNIQIIIIIIVAVAIVATASLVFLRNDTTFVWRDTPNNVYDTTVIVVGDKDCAPYSFIDNNGKASGYYVELIYELADRMKVNVDLRLVTYSEAIRLFDSGAADVLLNAVYDASSGMSYTRPLTMLTYVAFSKSDEFRALEDLQNSNIAVLKGDPIISTLFYPFNIGATTHAYATYNDLLEAVDDNYCQYAVLPEYVGNVILRENNLDLYCVTSDLAKVLSCLAVQNANKSLLTICNYQISQMGNDKALSTISDHWLNKYIQPTGYLEIMSENIDIVIIFLLVVVLMVLVAIFTVERMSIRKIYLQEERARIFEETSDNTLFEYYIDSDDLRFTYKDGEKTLHKEVSGFLRGGVYKNYVSADYQEPFAHAMNDSMEKDDITKFEFLTKLLTDDMNWYRITMRRMKDIKQNAISLVGRMENINEEKIKQDEVVKRATIDSLTGICNRPTFFDKVDAILACGKRINTVFTILDIDNFKNINDTRGHTQGDAVLAEFAALLRKVFSMNEIIGRFGGDEFVIFDVDVTQKAFTNKIEYFRQCLKAENGALKDVTASFGVIVTRSVNVDSRSLLEAADTVLYEVKENGKNDYKIVQKKF